MRECCCELNNRRNGKQKICQNITFIRPENFYKFQKVPQQNTTLLNEMDGRMKPNYLKVLFRYKKGNTSS